MRDIHLLERGQHYQHQNIAHVQPACVKAGFHCTFRRNTVSTKRRNVFRRLFQLRAVSTYKTLDTPWVSLGNRKNLPEDGVLTIPYLPVRCMPGGLSLQCKNTSPSRTSVFTSFVAKNIVLSAYKNDLETSGNQPLAIELAGAPHMNN